MIRKPTLITYITAGDPDIPSTLEFLRILAKYSDLIELGIPFSDPMADGKTIEKSHYRALKSGTKVMDVLNVVREFKREFDVPIVLMSYYNPIYVRGVESFVGNARGCGVDGMLIVDLPVEESDEYLDVCCKYDMKTVFLASPNTSNERLRVIDEVSTGFVYLVSLYGTTGERDEISSLAFDLVSRARSICRNPLAVGFGISKSEHVKDILNAGADGVVVGSAIVKLIEKFGRYAGDEIERKCRELRRGLIL